MAKRVFIPYHISPLGKEEIAAARQAMERGCISGNGPFGRRLEKTVKAYTGARYALFTTSCTSAIEMALMALGISKGDEVICPSFSFVSVASSIVRSGARLVFIDIDENTLNVSAAAVKKAITPRTKAIIPVHYAGHSCEMDAINKIAKDHGVKIIEDAAQAIGSFYKGRHLGTIGDIGCISLHGTKNVTCGEGGIFLTNNDKLAGIADIIREKGTNRSEFLRGKVDKYHWVSLGSSYVQSDILAAVAIEQMKKIERINSKRREHASYLDSRVEKHYPLLRRQKVIPGSKPNWHIYAVLLKRKKDRDRFIMGMRAEGVECLTHFVPLHTSYFAKKYLGYKKGDFPATEKACDTLVRIPVYPEVEKRGIEHVAEAIDKVMERI